MFTWKIRREELFTRGKNQHPDIIYSRLIPRLSDEGEAVCVCGFVCDGDSKAMQMLASLKKYYKSLRVDVCVCFEKVIF